MRSCSVAHGQEPAALVWTVGDLRVPPETHAPLPVGLAVEKVLPHHNLLAASLHLQVSLGRTIKTFATKMVITGGNEGDRGGQERESREESVLAMLGIVGTILNLVVIIFVYIYTTL